MGMGVDDKTPISILIPSLIDLKRLGVRHVSYVWEYPRLRVACCTRGGFLVGQVTPSAAYYSCRPLSGSPLLVWTTHPFDPDTVPTVTPDDLICPPVEDYCISLIYCISPE